MARCCLTKKILQSDPALEARFHDFLRSNFTWDRVNGCIIGPYNSRRVQELTHSRTPYWILYLYFESFKWYTKEHTLIKFLTTSSWDGEADHINHDGLNNTEQNLRFVSQVVNAGNRRANLNSSSGYPGVSWYNKSRKWLVQSSSRIDGLRKTHNHGYFTSFHDACQKSHDVRVSLGRYAPPVPSLI